MRLKFGIRMSNPGLYVVAITIETVPDGVASRFTDPANAAAALAVTASTTTRPIPATRRLAQLLTSNLLGFCRVARSENIALPVRRPTRQIRLAGLGQPAGLFNVA